MPWETPTLKDIRGIVRDNIGASLPGADASVPNSVLRVLSDAQGGLCHLTLQYIDWLALQMLPDTAETEWLDRHGAIWLVNSDNSRGRKQASFAQGMVTFTGVNGTVVPINTRMAGPVDYETTMAITIGAGPTNVPARALDPGMIGNLNMGDTLGLTATIPGADGSITIVEMTGGTDTENDDDLRARILHRIQNPAMGGSEADYITWATAVPGVTRAWAAPEQGLGTITVRFLMDDLRAADDGWPIPTDVNAVQDYLDQKRPVTVKDCYVFAPFKQFIDVTIQDLMPDTAESQAAAEASIRTMLRELAHPGQTIYAAWVSYAVMNTPGIESFTLMTTDDYIMPDLGHMAVLGTLLFE
jgi:uncharacterized phage protein gp47/JayE